MKRNHDAIEEARRHAIRRATHDLGRQETEAFRTHCRLYTALRAFHHPSVGDEAVVVAAAILTGTRGLEAILDAMPTAGRGAKP